MSEFMLMIEGDPAPLQADAELQSLRAGSVLTPADGATLTCHGSQVRRGVVESTAMLTFGLSIAGGITVKLVGDWLSQKFLSKGFKITISSAGASAKEVEELKKILDALKE